MEQPIVIENSEVLKKRIAAAGFGNRFDKEIDSALAAGKTEIRPFTSEVIENKRMDFEPEIKIKDSKGYFNGFKGTLHNEDGTTVSQWFKASDRISMDESHILMMDQKHPRAILKTYYDETGEKYNQWLQLDFTKKTENGNYLTKRYNNFDQVSKLNDYDFLELSTVKQKAIAAAYMSEGKEIELTPVNRQCQNGFYESQSEETLSHSSIAMVYCCLTISSESKLANGFTRREASVSQQ